MMTRLLSAFSLLVGGVLGAQQVTLTDKESLGNALSKAVDVLAKYYVPEWDTDLGDTLIAWFQRGMIAGTLLDYHQVSGDPFHDARASTSLGLAAFGKEGDLLGGSQRSLQAKLLGKWNDDIAWWALSMTTGAEIFGKDAVMTNSVPYLDVAIKTWHEIIEPDQWDENTCGGGFFWSRDRQSQEQNQALYKSSITHTEFILLSGKLAVLTANATYVDWASKVFNWMKSSGFILPNNHIIDGAYAPDCTTRRDAREFSYTSGTLLAGFGYLFQATKDPKWMSEATDFLSPALQQFTNNGIIVESNCEPSNTCKRNQKAFKAQFVKGLGHLYRFSDSEDMKRRIQDVIDTTVKSMLSKCDAAWNCPYSWLPNAGLDTDVFNQHPAAQLLITAAMIHSSQSDIRQVDTVATDSSSSPSNTRKKNGGSTTTVGMRSLVSLVILFTFL